MSARSTMDFDFDTIKQRIGDFDPSEPASSTTDSDAAGHTAALK